MSILELHKYLSIIPVDELPSMVVLSDEEYDKVLEEAYLMETSKFSTLGFTDRGKFIRVRKATEWNAEKKYRDRLSELEAKIKKLEEKVCT